MISPLLYATWLLCGLGAVVFVSTSRKLNWLNLAIIGAISLTLKLWAGNNLPDPQQVGLFALFAAVLLLFQPNWNWFAAFSAGIMVAALGYSPLFMLLALVAAVAAYRVTLPLPVIREEALVGVAIFGLVVAVAPSIAAGWQSALALNIADKANTSLAMPNWVLLLVAGSVLIGGLYQGIYRRR